MVREATKPCRINGLGTCTRDATGRPAIPDPWPPPRAKAGTLVPVARRISVAIAESQRIRLLIAQPLGATSLRRYGPP